MPAFPAHLTAAGAAVEGACGADEGGDDRASPELELPDMNEELDDPVTPVRKRGGTGKVTGTGMGVLGMGTPEVDIWIEAGKAKVKAKTGAGGRRVDWKEKDKKGKGKIVVFDDDAAGRDSDKENEDSDGDQDGNVEEDRDEDEDGQEDDSMVIQISPRRPPPSRHHVPSAAASWTSSPLRHAGIPPSPGGTSPQDLLRTIVRDIMGDFQRETRAEITGLHLDLVRAGRGWKKELREVMDGYVGDLRELREENKALREENERLRRGY